MGNDSEHKLCASKELQMWEVLALLLAILAFILSIVCNRRTRKEVRWPLA